MPNTTMTSSALQSLLLAQVEAFRVAQLRSDGAALDALCLPELSYSHSNGNVEDKVTFVTNASNGRYVFNHLEYKDLTHSIVGSVAVVRYQWLAQQTWTNGNVTDTHMAILMVWVQQADKWKLLARSATKLG